MNDEKDEELLIEAAASAFRPPDALGRVRAHRAWHDLGEAGRERAFEVASKLRRLEAALDPEGLSAASRAVLARLGR